MDDPTTKQVRILTDAGAVRLAFVVAALGQLRSFRIRWLAGIVTVGTLGGTIIRAKLGL
jgi:hypothetical protein